ncbi:MAG: hypothetical protein WC779_04290 [Candidatus Omnitrophota bacterium]|jgi:hypothetical protein
MKPVKPVYIKLIVAAIVVWVIGISIIVTDLYLKVGKIEHEMIHTTSPHPAH